MMGMRSVVRVREKQLSWRLGRVLVIKGVVQVSSTVQVGEKQLGGRSGGVMGMRSTVPNSLPR